ncbi:unnamed protein product [Paramecium sonneborni]|uniref:Uncharacterized protein n=1 Tax=Paramecium sonneborni TaxID=65129 RepID=A0A8S1NI90_9CILI|nr:unnamed protein product [Paramecium sonneborni]
MVQLFKGLTKVLQTLKKEIMGSISKWTDQEQIYLRKIQLLKAKLSFYLFNFFKELHNVHMVMKQNKYDGCLIIWFDKVFHCQMR